MLAQRLRRWPSFNQTLGHGVGWELDHVSKHDALNQGWVHLTQYPLSHMHKYHMNYASYIIYILRNRCS